MLGIVTWSVAWYLLAGHGLNASHAGRVTRRTAQRELEDEFPDVRRARQKARERLGDSQCQAVLTDFRSLNGQGLDDVLRMSNRTAQEQFDLLVLKGGLGRPLCERGVSLAFTQVGSSAVSICVQRFMLLPPREQEAVLIHEMLHSLGLGEGPPESVAITAQVLKRCSH